MRYVTNGDNKERSGAHRKVEEIVKDMGLSFMSEQHFSPYTVDIYLPEWHIAVEIDGPLHVQSKDEKKDEYLLQEFALPVLRINTKRAFRIESIEDRILEFIDLNCENVDVRKEKWRTKL